MVVAGLSGLLYPSRMMRAVQDINNSTLLPFFGGMMALIMGLLIVSFHNTWGTTLEVIVSLVGWAALVEGFAMFLLPDGAISAILRPFSNKMFFKGYVVVALALGAYLLYATMM